MSKEMGSIAITESRVVARRGTSSASAERRRLFQRHLLLYLAVTVGISALDVAVVEPQGMQWAWWLVVPWTLVFAIHFLGLKARGYSFAELFVPPKTEKAVEDYPAPLDYELVRVRQIRDGIEDAASSVAKLHADAARAALEAVEDLASAMERLVASAHGEKQLGEERALRLVPKAKEAVHVLEDLHEALIGVEVMDEPVEDLPIQEVRERAEKLAEIESS